MQNKINIENYEAYLLDYMEGNLSKEDLVELQIFAAQHSELNIDLNDLELVELITDDIGFENKNSLKKVGISDEKFVAYIENELNPEEKNNIEALCAKDEKLAKDLRLFKHTVLASDTGIIFENKNKLKKQETKVLWLFSREVLSVAASLILIMGLWFMFRNFMPGNEPLNSQKINGIGKVNTIALHKTKTAKTFTPHKATDIVLNTIHSNPVAYSNKKVENKTTAEESQKLIANNTPTGNVNNEPEDIQNDVIRKKEETNTGEKPAKYAFSNDPAVKKNKTSNSFVIIEKAYDEDEKQLAFNQKSGFWKKAMKALNNLNKLGVKKVGGTETTYSNNDQTLLSMGNFSIENKRYNAE